MPKAADGAGARHLKVGLGFTENRCFLGSSGDHTATTDVSSLQTLGPFG